MKRTISGFTSVEIIIVVTVIAVFAAIAIPRLLRAHKHSQASSVIKDLNAIDKPSGQYAIEINKRNTAEPRGTSGANNGAADWTNYLTKGINLTEGQTTGGASKLVSTSSFTLSDILSNVANDASEAPDSRPHPKQRGASLGQPPIAVTAASKPSPRLFAISSPSTISSDLLASSALVSGAANLHKRPKGSK